VPAPAHPSHPDIRSYIDTARKHGKNAFAALYDLMASKP